MWDLYLLFAFLSALFSLSFTIGFASCLDDFHTEEMEEKIRRWLKLSLMSIPMSIVWPVWGYYLLYLRFGEGKTRKELHD